MNTIFVGCSIPVFGQQLRGCYISDGERYPHYAVPGWYIVEAIQGRTVVIRRDKPGSDPFECSRDMIDAVLGASLESVANGLNPEA